jgi:hypothetical protein
MLNKTENNTNINSVNPCSVEGLIALKDKRFRQNAVDNGPGLV